MIATLCTGITRADKYEERSEHAAEPGAKPPEPVKPVEVVFAYEGDHAKMIPVKTGISDSDFFEIVSGLTEGQQIISGGYKAISKELDDGKKVKLGGEPAKAAKKD